MPLPLSRESLSADKAAEKTAVALVKLQEMQLGRRLGMMLMIAAAVAVGLMVFFWSQGPKDTPLYTGLDVRATAEAADLLRAAQIPVRIDPATGAISVPDEYLHEARLKLAESKLTDSGRLGFELMERDPGFGVSQFIETARYQHALETELVRTIKSLRPVRDARVHLAIPKPSAFTRKRELASASVVLELRTGTSLTQAQVDAIAHMVASGIPDLAPERVTVVDQSGQLLSRQDKNSEEAISAAQFEQVRRQETTFSRRIRELLEPMTGAGRVNAEVTVDMDFSVLEEARELYNGEPPKLRSEQVSENSSTIKGPEGVPGAASNTPPGPDAATETAQTPLEHSQSATRNFELDRTLQHTRQPGGRIRRITTAVLIDHVPRPDASGNIALQALSAEELERVEALVQQAVGFDASRGDMVSVMNTRFVNESSDIVDEPVPWWQQWWVRDALRLGLGALVILALLFGVLRPAIRQLTGAADKAKSEQDIATTEIDDTAAAELAEDTLHLSLEGSEHAALEAPEPPDAYETRLQLAREAVRADSKRVAQVVKGWIDDGN